MSMAMMEQQQQPQEEQYQQGQEGAAADMEEVAVTYMTLDALVEQGISPNDVQKLKDAGYNTVESVSTLPIVTSPAPCNFAKHGVYIT
jgi:hypothetical protein